MCQRAVASADTKRPYAECTYALSCFHSARMNAALSDWKKGSVVKVMDT